MMQESDPSTWPLITWVIALSMAFSGGLINWFGQSKNFIDKRKFNLFELFGELFTSGFVGVGLFMIGDSLGQPMGINAAVAGIGGHMATRFLFLVERIIENKLMEKGHKYVDDITDLTLEERSAPEASDDSR